MPERGLVYSCWLYFLLAPVDWANGLCRRKPWALHQARLTWGLFLASCLLLASTQQVLAHNNKIKADGPLPTPKAPALPLAAYEASPTLGTDFRLINHHGQPITRAHFAGGVVLMSFGYIDCPDACPRLLGVMAEVRRILGKPQRLHLVFVSINPQKLPPSRLKAHVARFSAGIMGITGPAAHIKNTTRAYQVRYRQRFTEASQKTKLGYLIDHSLVFYLLDATGKTRYAFPYDISPEVVVAGGRKLLGEGG